MIFVVTAAKNIEEQSKMRRIDVIRKYYTTHLIYYPRACGVTCLEKKLEEIDI